MKNAGKTILTLFAGMILGAALFSGGVAHAAEIFYKAIPSTNIIYLDGQRVELAAFTIDGSNYVKLRDVGELVGFNVYWDGAVQIDSDAPYTGVAPVQADASIRVGSYKGNTLATGEISGLMVSESDCTAVSSDPNVVRVENVLGHWTANAQAPGTATITVTAPDGRTGSVTITVQSAIPSSPAGESTAALTDNMAIRLELVRLINQTRVANGVSELPVSEALMNAAQACSNQRYTWHHAQEEGKAAADAGYPYGFGDNLTVFTGTEDAAKRAVTNWINSPGHFQTMIDPDCDCIGVGVTQYDGITYCYMFVGIPNSIKCITEYKPERPFSASWRAFLFPKRKGAFDLWEKSVSLSPA